MGLGGVLIHGIIFHYSRINGQLMKTKRWAYVTNDSLFIFLDAYNPTTCFRVFLVQADIGISYEEDDNPWITITERNNATYFIQPEQAYEFNKWFQAIQFATEFKGQRPNSAGFAADVPTPLPPNTTDWDHNRILQETTKKQSRSGRPETHLEYSPVPRGHLSVHPDNFRHSALNEEAPGSPDRPVPPARPRHRKLTATPTTPSARTQQPQETPPPRPPRSSNALQTVKEHPSMRDTEIVATKPLTELQSRYPVSGLAKRMSISASDLLGKSRDELILLLLQLNREKANLQRWYDYFMKQMELVRADKGESAAAEEELSAIRVELDDVTGQLRLSEPMVKFLGNMLRMGDLYGGDDVMFASEYRKHLLPEHELIPPKESIKFARDIEAQEVARTLNATIRQTSTNSKPASPTLDNSPNLANWIAENGDLEAARAKSRSSSKGNIKQWAEDASFRQKRLQLESELADLDALCAPHDIIHRELRATQKSLRQFEPIRSREALNMIGPSATLLRRMKGDSRGRRSSMPSATASLGRTNQYQDRNKLFNLANEDSDPRSIVEEQKKRGSWRPRRQLSSNYQSGEFTPIGTLNRDRSIKRFRSIPEHLDLLCASNSQLNRSRSQTFDWESSRMPLTPFDPTDEVPTKFSPVRSVRSRTDTRSESDQNRGSFESRFRPPVDIYSTNVTGQEHRTRVEDDVKFFERKSSEIPALSATPLPSLSTRRENRFSEARNFNLLSVENDISNLPEWQIQRRSNRIPDDNQATGGSRRKITSPRPVSPTDRFGSDSVGYNEVREKSAISREYSSLRNNIMKTVAADESIYSNVFTTPEKYEMDRDRQLHRQIEDYLISYGSSRNNNRYQPDLNGSNTNHTMMKHFRTEDNLTVPKKTTAERTGSRPMSRTRTGEQDQTLDRGVNYAQVDDEDSATLFSSDSDIPSNLMLREVHLPRDQERSGRGFPPNQNSRWVEQQAFPPDGALDLQRQDEQKETQDYPFTTESVESVFAPPEPLNIGTRYVPSPPARQSTDPDSRRNREKRLSALREMLLHQSLASDRDVDVIDHSTDPNSTNRIERHAQRLNLQEQLAKEAASSVVALSGRSYAGHTLNA